jgi:phosphohistidine phosphatase
MKNLFIIRHAKSSWKDTGMDDHERPLNKRGERDAPFMGHLLKEKKISPDLMVSSTATRAYSTATEFAKQLDYKKEKIVKAKELYLAERSGLVNFITNMDEKVETLFLFGHNPGVSTLANYLCSTEAGELPTCAICGLRFEIDSWKDIGPRQGELILFEFPKKYFPDAGD